VNRMTVTFGLLAVLVAVVIAGCGGGNDSSSGEGAYGSTSKGSNGGGEKSSQAPESSGGKGAVVSLGNSSDLGMILVDAEGMTLYDFHKDKGTRSSCYGACEEAWPPLTTEGAPQVGNGASDSMLGTTERKDGTMQVTYAGHPLYTFVEDKKPGDANGNDVTAFGAQWYALQGSGEEAEE